MNSPLESVFVRQYDLTRSSPEEVQLKRCRKQNIKTELISTYWPNNNCEDIWSTKIQHFFWTSLKISFKNKTQRTNHVWTQKTKCKGEQYRVLRKSEVDNPTADVFSGPVQSNRLPWPTGHWSGRRRSHLVTQVGGLLIIHTEKQRRLSMYSRSTRHTSLSNWISLSDRNGARFKQDRNG